MKERGFDEEDVRFARERSDPSRVVFVIDDVGDVGDLLSGHDLEHRALQLAQRSLDRVCLFVSARGRPDRRFVRRIGEHGFLELAQPRPHGEAFFRQPVLPHVDVTFFLESESETGDFVIEGRGAHAKALGSRDRVLLARGRRQGLATE